MQVTTLGHKRQENVQKYTQIKTVYQDISYYKRFCNILMKMMKRMHSKKERDKYTKIDDNVYMGQSPSSSDKISDISAVVCLQEQHEKLLDYPKFQFVLNIPTPDFTSPSREQISEALDFMTQHKNENILIHCKAGVGRSAIISVAYISKKKGMPLPEAHKYVSKQRNISRLYIMNGISPQWKVLNNFLNTT